MAIEMLHESGVLLVIDFEANAEKYLGEVLEQKTKKIKKVNLVQTDVNTLELATKSDGIILGIRLGKTSRKQIQRELEVCEIQNIKVLGVIVISN